MKPYKINFKQTYDVLYWLKERHIEYTVVDLAIHPDTLEPVPCIIEINDSFYCMLFELIWI